MYASLKIRRFIALALFLLLAPAPGFSQSAKDQAAEIVSLVRAGKIDEALKLGLEIVARLEAIPGVERSQLASTLEGVADLHETFGRYREAERLYLRLVAIREAAGEDADYATALNGLGLLYQSQGRMTDAEHLYRKSLRVRESVLPGNHPDVAQSFNNLALVYWSLGRFAEAEANYDRCLAIVEKSLGPEHRFVGTTLNNIGTLYRDQGRTAEAEKTIKRALEVREKALGLDHPEVAQTLNNLASLYMDLRRFKEARDLHARALSIRERALPAQHTDIAQSLQNLAAVSEALGRANEAEPLYQRSLAIVEASLGADHPAAGTVLNNLAEHYREQGRFSDAEPLYKRALAIREAAIGPHHPDFGASLVNMATLYFAQRRFKEAQALYDRSLAIFETALDHSHAYRGTVLNNLARLSLVQEDFIGAAVYWRASAATAVRRTQLGMTGRDEGSGKRETFLAKRQFEGLIKTSYQLARSGKGNAEQLASEMFEAAQAAQASDAADAIAQMAARFARGAPELAAIVRERQDLVAEWRDKDQRLLAAKSLKAERRSAATEKALADRKAEIDARLAVIDAALARIFPDYAAMASAKSISVAEVQASLRADEALVLFLDTDQDFRPLPEETFIWVVKQKSVRWLRSSLGTSVLKREVAALRCGLDITAWHGEGGMTCADLLNVQADRLPQAGDMLPFDLNRAHSLFAELLGEVAAQLEGMQLLLVPSGPLTTLPFHVLLTEPPKPQSTFQAAAWLAKRNAITVLPSAAALTSLRRDARASLAARPMIGFANPLLDGDQADLVHGAHFKAMAARARERNACTAEVSQQSASMRRVLRSSRAPSVSGLADLTQLKRQLPLPETADEVCAVARQIGADVSEMRIGAAATESAVKSLSSSGALAQYRVIHFATHGFLAGQLSGTQEPGLMLTPPLSATQEDDGFLSASEIGALKLDAEWVILSACNTAAGAGEASEALSGVAQAFFYAGARSLLVSHWEVDSDAAVKLVTAAISELARLPEIGRAEAFRRAMNALMSDATRPNSWVPPSHPSVWAPFVVVGEGGREVR